MPGGTRRVSAVAGEPHRNHKDTVAKRLAGWVATLRRGAKAERRQAAWSKNPDVQAALRRLADTLDRAAALVENEQFREE
jgi:hypothetical protein